ncbi:MAG: putative short-chain type dehydrogenase/reductase [Frankiales bacterium]|nr:putative short-chain type dehydrogenase/reductase [Frankiales bacterium]
MSSNDGRVVVITGAGGGIGRAEALLFAQEGARVVVNDVSAEGANAVVDQVRAAGGEAVANTDDISDWDGAGRLVQIALDRFGGLDTLVNNAGILRDRMFVNMSIDDWDAVMKVHLRGTFAPTKHAVAYWREQSKAGEPRVARIVNTSSPSGIYGNVGQANYGAAKAGIAALTQILGEELWRYGILSNAIAPSALTAMTEGLTGYKDKLDELEARTGWKNPGGPEHIVALVVWLGSPLAQVNGRVFNVRAGHVSVAEGWHPGPAYEKEGGFEVAELDAVLPDLIARAVPQVNAYGDAKAYGA